MTEDREGNTHLRELIICFEKIKDLKPHFSSEVCIYRVHEKLRTANPEAYTPLTISIGPNHHKPCNSRLWELEGLKEFYTLSLLNRAQGVGVEECWKKLKELEGRAKSYYNDHVRGLGDEFVKMLLLDGCFILEFVIRSFLRALGGVREYDDDPIYNISGMERYIVRDMLLLENQLPFFVLQSLYDMIIGRSGNIEFSDMVEFVFRIKIGKMNIFSLLGSTELNPQEIKHLLQAVHIFCRPPQPLINNGKIQLQQEEACSSCCFWEQPQKSTFDSSIVRAASELQEAGVDIKKVKETTTTTLFDIKFNHGVLEIPSFTLFDLTETFLRNLIAYEQHSWDVRPKYFTDYAVFMDDLINTEKDVNLLRLKDVLLNGLGDEKEVTHLFNNLCRGIRPSSNDDFYYKDVYNELNGHYKKSWNVAMAKLRRNYFHSPWAGISTFAAILLLSLAIVQTVVAALDLYK
ncbi:UPF0481 protein At3g47200-like [Ipomoea triloba]|uniref:UPF0481 protein At3g47200-like n=1 Tax=Ipomoea triloba TaxID=35885 RepID=UPI00125E61D4|nr:UPF0481 protein At3g47200-like [Ipomoea triloba]